MSALRIEGQEMQKSNIVLIALISINIILAVICGFFYIKKDRTEPKLSFTADDTVYTVGMDTDELIKGMSAIDSKDGDISDRIVVEKILENKDKNVAVVYYAVCDYDGNVAKASREFPARFDLVAGAQVSDSEDAESEEGEEQTEEGDEEADNEELTDEEKTKAEEEAKKAEEEAKKAEEEAKKAEEEAKKAEEEAKKAEEEKKNEEKSEEEKKAEEKKAEEQKKAADAAAAEAARKSAGAPYIELNYAECKVPIGGGVPWADAIKTLRDDKDGYEPLFRNLVASKFDNSKKGDYSVTLFTTDSDKNRSNTVTMLVHVQ